MAKAPKPLHLTASMQVVLHSPTPRHVTVDDARQAVPDAALGTQGVAGPETQELVVKLEKMTGVSIADLATHAEDWPQT